MKHRQEKSNAMITHDVLHIFSHLLHNWMYENNHCNKSAEMFRVKSVITRFVLVSLYSEDQLVVGLQGMSVFGVIDQFVASQDVCLVQSFRKLSVLDCCPLHGHFQLILAAIHQEADKVEDGQIQENDQDDQSWFGKDDGIVENSVKVGLEDGHLERD